jgi:hypothetical protein
MLRIDKDKFFAGYRAKFGGITQEHNTLTGIVANLDFQLDMFGEDCLLSRVSDAANMLGTQTVETRRHYVVDGKRKYYVTFGPIDEQGSDDYFANRYGPQTRVGKVLGNRTRQDAIRMHGRGYVQLTGLYNYTKATKRLKVLYGIDVDLVAEPDLAKDPFIAYHIMSGGMHEGWFTGKKLADYARGSTMDHYNARRIINPGELSTPAGRVIVKLIERNCLAFEDILREAQL